MGVKVPVVLLTVSRRWTIFIGILIRFPLSQTGTDWLQTKESSVSNILNISGSPVHSIPVLSIQLWLS
jgi:hypothetical protein